MTLLNLGFQSSGGEGSSLRLDLGGRDPDCRTRSDCHSVMKPEGGETSSSTKTGTQRRTRRDPGGGKTLMLCSCLRQAVRGSVNRYPLLFCSFGVWLVWLDSGAKNVFQAFTVSRGFFQQSLTVRLDGLYVTHNWLGS